MNEQERAERLSQEIDRLIRGERMSEGDPLLETAKLLAKAPITPSRTAQANFQQQVEQWFGTSPPISHAMTHATGRLLWGFVGGVIVIILIGFSFVLLSSQKLPTTPAPSVTSTTIQTVSPMPTETPLAQTIMPTPIRQVVSGRISAIRDKTLVVEGLAILMNDGSSRFCVDDLVKMTITLMSDQRWHTDTANVLIEFNACASTPSLTPTLIATKKASCKGGTEDGGNETSSNDCSSDENNH